MNDTEQNEQNKEGKLKMIKKNNQKNQTEVNQVILDYQIKLNKQKQDINKAIISIKVQ